MALERLQRRSRDRVPEPDCFVERCLPSGENATDKTGPEWPSSVGSAAPVATYPVASGDIQDSWLDDHDPADGYYFASSTTGWTNNELAMEWLTRVFDCHTKRKASHGREPASLSGRPQLTY